MALNCSVSSLILINAVGRNQNGCHHCKASVSSCDHVGHNIAVIVLARPDIAAVGADNSCYGIINESIEILDACCCELILILVLEDLGKDILEAVIVLLGDSILCSEPYVLLCIKCKVEAASCKA